MVVVGAVLYSVAHALSVIQTAVRLQRPRALSAAETDIVRQVFRGAVDPHAIRIVAGRSGLFGVSRRALTIGTTIYLKAFDTATRPDVLVHECTHVWQFRRVGSRYMAQALRAQWFVHDAYNWRAEIARGHTTWPDFNREAQAQFVQDVYRADPDFYADDPPSGTVSFDGTDYTALARQTAGQLRHPKEPA